jgi:Protein of unknown function (DUF1656)
VAGGRLLISLPADLAKPGDTGLTGNKGRSTMNVPTEFNIGGVYMPPMLIAAILGTIAAVVTARFLNRYRLSRYFFYPPVVFVSLVVIFTFLVGTVLIPF